MNYMGSKYKLAQHLLPIMLHNRKEGQYFVDLFCGGCNLVDKVNGLRIANDKNIYLIDMFKALVNNEKLPLSISKELYDDVKNDYDTKGGKYSNAEIGWIGFMASFKGKFFNGYCGDASNDRNYITEHINNILYQVPLLKGIEFHSGNYSDVEIPDNAIIYCDIPYKHTTKYKGADSFDYDKFYDYVRNFTYRGGGRIYVSEYSMPDDFVEVWSMGVTNALSTTNTYLEKEGLYVHESIAEEVLREQRELRLF